MRMCARCWTVAERQALFSAFVQGAISLSVMNTDSRGLDSLNDVVI